MVNPEAEFSSSELSKRAIRRLVQRAFVLVGRERHLRQQIRNLRLTILWAIEDVSFECTLVIDRGTLEFHRGRAAKPDITIGWKSADEFVSEIEDETREPGFELSGDVIQRRTIEPIYNLFRLRLRELFRNPVDENGDPLV